MVGADFGKYEREVWVESVAIAPAQRYIVDVRFDQPGEIPMVNQVESLNAGVAASVALYAVAQTRS